MSTNQKLLFAITFSLMLVGRLCIAGTGYLDDPDEYMYNWIHRHFSEFAQFSTWSRCMWQPPEIIIRLLEYISVLPIASLLGKTMHHPDILYFVGLYNIIISLFILYVFYHILLKLQFTIELAITGVVLLGTLFNYNMYTRHILPYDHALLFQLVALNLLLRDKINNRTVFLAGLLSAIGLTGYFGCFMFVLINGGYLLITRYKTLKIALINIVLFTLPFMLLILCYEAITRINDRSYLGYLTEYYDTIYTEVSFDEGLIYVFLYFYLVEKWWGIILLLFFFTGSYLLFKKADSIKTKQVLLLGTVAYLAYGGLVYFSRQFPFHGRILHIFYPFIIIGMLCWLQQQKLWRENYMALAVALFAIINYGFVIKDLNSIGYPRNAIYKYHLFEQPNKVSFIFSEEIPGGQNYQDRTEWYIDTAGTTDLTAGKYALINLGFLKHFPDDFITTYKPFVKADTDSLVFEQLHFQSHPAYTLEYCTRTGRQFYISKQLKIRVVKIKDI